MADTGYYQRYVKPYRERHRAAGLCYRCPRKPVRAGLCKPCWASQKRATDRWVAARTSAGLCRRCGTPAWKGYVHCRKHVLLMRGQVIVTDRKISGPAALVFGIDRLSEEAFRERGAAIARRAKAWLGTLPARERAIATRRLLGPPDKLLAIATDYGISRERVRQIENELAKGLKAWLDRP